MEQDRIQFSLLRLARLEIWFVAGFVVLSIVFPSTTWIALGVSGLFWLIRKAAYNRFSKRTPLDWAIALLILALLISSLVSVAPENTILQALRLLSGIALFYAIINVVSKRNELANLLLACVITGLAVSIYSIIGKAWSLFRFAMLPIGFVRTIDQVFEVTNPNVIAGYLVILIPLAISGLIYLSETWKSSIRIIIALSIITMMGVLLLTGSRGAWFALAIALMLLASISWRWGWICIPIGFIVILSASVILPDMRIIEVITQNPALGGITRRLEVWSQVLNLGKVFPSTGAGIGNINELVKLLFPFYSLDQASVPHTHNLYLQVLGDMGSLGLIAWVSILGGVTVFSWQLFRKGKTGNNIIFTSLGVGLVSSQAVLIIHGMMDAVTWTTTRPAPLVWAIWGLAIAAFNKSEMN